MLNVNRKMSWKIETYHGWGERRVVSFEAYKANVQFNLIMISKEIFICNTDQSLKFKVKVPSSSTIASSKTPSIMINLPSNIKSMLNLSGNQIINVANFQSLEAHLTSILDELETINSLPWSDSTHSLPRSITCECFK